MFNIIYSFNFELPTNTSYITEIRLGRAWRELNLAPLSKDMMSKPRDTISPALYNARPLSSLGSDKKRPLYFAMGTKYAPHL